MPCKGSLLTLHGHILQAPVFPARAARARAAPLEQVTLQTQHPLQQLSLPPIETFNYLWELKRKHYQVLDRRRFSPVLPEGDCALAHLKTGRKLTLGQTTLHTGGAYSLGYSIARCSQNRVPLLILVCRGGASAVRLRVEQPYHHRYDQRLGLL